MVQLTIRGVGEELHRAIKEHAKRRGLSINRYVLSVIRESVGLGSGKKDLEMEFHDLDHLAGTWSQQAYDEFLRDLESQREIDRGLW